VYTDGATASRFMLDVSATGWTYLGESWNIPTVVGTSITGVSAVYDACIAGTIYLAMVSFMGTSAPVCTYIGIVADPLAPSGKIESIDCYGNELFPTGGQAIVNSISSCRCSCPVEKTTWGGIKALYE